MIKHLAYDTLFIIILFLLAVFAFLIYMTLTKYKPKDKTEIETENNNEKVLNVGDKISIMTFNVGYCGLDKNQDFFVEGGKMSISHSRKQTIRNLKKITQVLVDKGPDFVLLQEVDVKSHRSYYVNEFQYIKQNLMDYASSFAVNYYVQWIPIPILKPMGGTHSGIVTLSKYKIKNATRFQFPGSESWPRSAFEVERCFLENRIAVNNGKELIIINTHLSAFDNGAKLRKQQLAFLKKYIIKQYSEGNYIIIGGDWNHVIPGTDPLKFNSNEKWPRWLHNMPEDFKVEDFSWAKDDKYPTARNNSFPYKNKLNFTAVIDGFYVSDNINVISTQNLKLEFENSDHNPVRCIFELRNVK